MTQGALGIDLGTSNTVVAAVDGNKVIVVPDNEKYRTHPSVVSFHPDGSIVVGRAAKARAGIDAANTVLSAKRLIGHPYASTTVSSMLGRCEYTIREGDNEQTLITTRAGNFEVPEISALVIRYVHALAVTRLGHGFEKSVITVPANFNDAQREATRVAGRIAGLDVLRILNEPTAAALAYGYGQQMNRRIVIYDFGGGTFDVTILELNNDIFEVLSTAGDPFLGGDDLDHILVGQMVQSFLKEHRVDLSQDIQAMARLRSVSERIKCRLSDKRQAKAMIRELAYGPGGAALDLDFAITVDDFNMLTKDSVQATLRICDEAMRLAGINSSQIDDVVMVGGTTRIPFVRDAVRAFFGTDIRTDINPDEVVAVGAAIQALALSRSVHGGASPEESAGSTETFAGTSVLLDVTPRALGIAVVGGYAETILERNVPIPIEQTRTFSTSQDNQLSVRIQVCQGESRTFEENQLMGELVLEDLRQAPRGQVKIEVTFEIDTNGMLQVSARDPDTGQAQQATIHLLGAVPEEAVAALAQRQADLPLALS